MQIDKERTGIEKKFYQLATQVVSGLGFHLYDLDYISGSHLLRLYIMNPQTKTAVLDDCVAVDRAMTPFLESESWVPSELTLEVSSPGIYRHLRTKEHFTLAVGEQLELALNSPLELKVMKDKDKVKLVKRQKLLAILKSVNDQAIQVCVVPEQTEHEIAFNIIKKANLGPDLESLTAL